MNKFSFVLASICLLALLFAACELFNGNVDNNFLQKIEEDILWTNADKLDVGIAYRQG